MRFLLPGRLATRNTVFTSPVRFLFCCTSWWTSDFHSLRRTFRSVDKDGSGFIDMFEFATMLRQWGVSFSPHQFQTAMKQLARGIEARRRSDRQARNAAGTSAAAGTPARAPQGRETLHPVIQLIARKRWLSHASPSAALDAESARTGDPSSMGATEGSGTAASAAGRATGGGVPGPHGTGTGTGTATGTGAGTGTAAGTAGGDNLLINFEGFALWWKSFSKRSGRRLLAVNFDATLMVHLREIRYFLMLNEELPEAAVLLYEMQGSLRSDLAQVESIVSLYNGMHVTLNDEEWPLVENAMNALDEVLSRGLTQLHWRSKGVKDYLSSTHNLVASLSHRLLLLKEKSQTIADILMSWGNMPVVALHQQRGVADSTASSYGGGAGGAGAHSDDGPPLRSDDVSTVGRACVGG